MSNGAACCVLQICCSKADAITALSSDLQAHAGLDATAADAAANHLMAHYDLAPAGSLETLKQAILAHVRAHPEIVAPKA